MNNGNNNDPGAGPGVPPCNPPVNQPLMEYNTSRLEMLGLATRLRTFLLGMSNAQQNDFRNEICTLFREFNRAYPAAGISEFEGLRLVMELGTNGERAGSYAEFASRISPHQVLVQAFRRLVNVL
jgi:hypothetical protein